MIENHCCKNKYWLGMFGELLINAADLSLSYIDHRSRRLTACKINDQLKITETLLFYFQNGLIQFGAKNPECRYSRWLRWSPTSFGVQHRIGQSLSGNAWWKSAWFVTPIILQWQQLRGCCERWCDRRSPSARIEFGFKGWVINLSEAYDWQQCVLLKDIYPIIVCSMPAPTSAKQIRVLQWNILSQCKWIWVETMNFTFILVFFVLFFNFVKQR